MKISIQELKKLSEKAISKYGYSEEESTVILDMLMYAQMRGNNQGIVKLIGKGLLVGGIIFHAENTRQIVGPALEFQPEKRRVGRNCVHANSELFCLLVERAPRRAD